MDLHTSFERESEPEDLVKLVRAFGEGDAGSSGANYGLRQSCPYEPSALMARKIILSDETLGAISRFEIFAASTDAMMGASAYKGALCRIMARMDGMFIAQLNGRFADYRTVCYFDFFSMGGVDGGKDGQIGPALATRRMLGAQHREVRCAQCAWQMGNLAYGIMNDTFELGSITPARISMLHGAISKTFHPSRKPGIRTQACPPAPDARRTTDSYRPPSPVALPGLLQDIADFANDSKLGPLAKSALVYYQLEATRMFMDDNDQLGRIILVCLWKRDGLISHIMPPISMTPALAMQTHAEKLRPYLYRSGASEIVMIDEWVYHAARASCNAFELELLCYREANELVAGWETALSAAGVRITRTVQRFLIEMVGMPVFSISLMAQLIEASFSTTAHITDSLVGCGIATQVSEGKRNRIYECPASLRLFDELCGRIRVVE